MPTQEDYDFLFKTVIVGDSNVGKTQILSRFIQNYFTHDSKPTVGVQFGTKTIQVGDVWVKNQIWDTAGQQKFRALTCAYYRGAVGAIIVFDISKSITFQHVSRWIKQVRQYSEPSVSILLVGNKIDLEHQQVKQQEIQNFASDYKLTYVSTSAFTGQNVDLAFETLIKQILVHTDPNIQFIFSDQQIQQTPNPTQTQNQPHQNKQTKNNQKSSTAPYSQKKQSIKREKPKIQAFSIEQKDKIKIKDKKEKDKNQLKKKKGCC